MTVVAAALLLWSGTSGALAVDKIKLIDGGASCIVSSSQTLGTMPPIDVAVTPGTRILLAADATGTSSIGPSWVRIVLTVKHADQTVTSTTFGQNNHGVCNANHNGPYDVTTMFNAGPNVVELTLLAGGTDSNGMWRGYWPTLYLVAMQGHVASAQGTQA